MFLTRLGFGSKIVITGDVTQIDLPDGKPSGLREAMRVLKKVEGIGICELTNADVVRHVMVQRIVKAYEEYETAKNGGKGKEIMAKRHYIPITADVPGVNEGQRAFIRKVIRTALAAEGVDFPCEVDVLLTNDEAIHQINLDMREVDRATDVLSFPEFDLQPGELPDGEDADPGTGLVPLGDMVISMEHVATQAKEYGHSNRRELAYLVVHSVLHLLGYDHLDEGPQKKQMRAREEAILAELGITQGGLIWEQICVIYGWVRFTCLVPAILLAGMFSGGGGDVAPFLLGLLAVGAVLAGAVCLKDKLDRMEETLKAVSEDPPRGQNRIGNSEGTAGSRGDQAGYCGGEAGYGPRYRLSVSPQETSWPYTVLR